MCEIKVITHENKHLTPASPAPVSRGFGDVPCVWQHRQEQPAGPACPFPQLSPGQPFSQHGEWSECLGVLTRRRKLEVLISAFS